MNDNLCFLQPQEVFGLVGRRLRNDDRDRDGQVSARIGNGYTCIAAGRRDKPVRAAPDVFFAGGTDTTNLKSAGRLQRFQLQPS